MAQFIGLSTNASRGQPGTLIAGAIALGLALIGLDPGAGTQGVYTLTFTGGSTSDTNGIYVTPANGAFPRQTVTWVPSASTTAGNVAACALALRASFPLSGSIAVSTTSTTVVITVNEPDEALTITEYLDPSSHFSIATTTPPAAGSTFAFGGFCIVGSGSQSGALAKWPATALSTIYGARLVITLTHAAATTYSAIITMTDPYGNQTKVASTSWAGGANLAAAVANGVTALTTLYAGTPMASLITSNAAAGTITIDAPVGWLNNAVSVDDDTAATIAAALTASDALPALGYVVMGGDYQPEIDGQGSTITAEGQPFTGWRLAYAMPPDCQWVVPATATAPTQGNPVYVDSATGYATPTPSRTTIATPLLWGPIDPTGLPSIYRFAA